jgi:hypothetical protein
MVRPFSLFRKGCQYGFIFQRSFIFHGGPQRFNELKDYALPVKRERMQIKIHALTAVFVYGI